MNTDDQVRILLEKLFEYEERLKVLEDLTLSPQMKRESIKIAKERARKAVVKVCASNEQKS